MSNRLLVARAAHCISERHNGTGLYEQRNGVNWRAHFNRLTTVVPLIRPVAVPGSSRRQINLAGDRSLVANWPDEKCRAERVFIAEIGDVRVIREGPNSNQRKNSSG